MTYWCLLRDALLDGWQPELYSSRVYRTAHDAHGRLQVIQNGMRRSEADRFRVARIELDE